MLELYHWEPNSFFLKPMIALAEKGVEFRSCYFDPTNFEQFNPDFPGNAESGLQLEREGPVLVHDGAIISSSFFMLEYIAEAFPGPRLLPADAYQRYRMHAWGQQTALSLASPVTSSVAPAPAVITGELGMLLTLPPVRANVPPVIVVLME